MAQYASHEWTAAMDELADLESSLAAAMVRGEPAASKELDSLLARHRAWVANMWGRPCPPSAYEGLAALYLSHPDFRKRYETIAPGFTDFLTCAMQAHAARHA